MIAADDDNVVSREQREFSKTAGAGGKKCFDEKVIPFNTLFSKHFTVQSVTFPRQQGQNGCCLLCEVNVQHLSTFCQDICDLNAVMKSCKLHVLFLLQGNCNLRSETVASLKDVEPSRPTCIVCRLQLNYVIGLLLTDVFLTIILLWLNRLL